MLAKFTDSEAAKFNNLQRQADWFIGYWQRQADRVIAEVLKRLDSQA